MIRVVYPGFDSREFLLILDPGSRGQKGTGSRCGFVIGSQTLETFG
jgi:hypothetical protein